ncbi:Plasmid recombination enzyme type 2 [Clostridia bacterium]|nr:Plasmid recombination enzyme type 2 [Clostridia bacterium]
MQKKNFTVVRNAGKTASSFEICERHNERENVDYQNADIIKERAGLNVQFRRVLSSDGTPETYEQTFNRLLAEGTIVKKGLKADAKVFGELVFDVNTDYFEQNGGYEFAKKFYAEAYRLAVKEVGSEDYILSAVMHADERNKEASERLGYDVFHYHLHVIYIPVVQKEVLWTKRCKDPALVGTVKEIIPQISHSKKWPMRVPVERDGKTIILNSYSLLQDRYFEHMREAGFTDFERGERGSTKEHLDVIDYKIQQDKKRLDALDQQIEKKEAKAEKLDEKISVKATKAATLAEIDSIGKPSFVGGVHLTDEEAKRLKSLARQTVKADERIAKLKKDIDTLQAEIKTVKRERDEAKIEAKHWHREFQDLKAKVKDYLHLAAKFPVRVKEFFTGLFREEQSQEQQREAERQQQLEHQQTKKKAYDRGM